MATNKDEFSARLVKARSTKGWSQQDLSSASGVAAAQISRYEQGTNTPRPQVVARLANALEVRFPWLLTGAGEPADVWLVGRNPLRVELPADLIRRIEQAASANRRLIDEEVQVRLEASFNDPPPSASMAHTRTSAASAEEQLQAARTDWAERFNLYRIEAQLDAVRTQHALAEMKVRMLDDKLDKLAYGGGSKVQMRALEVELEEARSFHKILRAREQEIFELLKAQQARADEASRAEMRRMHEAIDIEIQDDLKAVHTMEQQLGVPPERRTVFSTEAATSAPAKNPLPKKKP